MVANVSFLYPINAMYGMNCSKWCFAVYVSNSNDRAELFKPNLTKCSRGMYRSSLCTLNVQPLPTTYISPTQLRLLRMLPLATILRFIRGCGRMDIALVDEAIEVFLMIASVDYYI